ncbi:hypothetical protein BDF19DRAFT_437410, partial [Syncephalis fuscata]
KIYFLSVKLYLLFNMFRFTSRQPEITRPVLNFNEILQDLVQQNNCLVKDTLTLSDTSSLEHELTTLLGALKKTSPVFSDSATSTRNETVKDMTTPVSCSNEEESYDENSPLDKDTTTTTLQNDITENALFIAQGIHSLQTTVIDQAEKARHHLVTELNDRQLDTECLLNELTQVSHC